MPPHFLIKTIMSEASGHTLTTGQSKDTRRERVAAGQKGRVSGEVEITAAIVDRITFGGNIIETGTDS